VAYTRTKYISLLFTAVHTQSFDRKFRGQCGLLYRKGSTGIT